MDESKDLLEQILTANVLILAKSIAQDKKAKGVTSTGDYTDDAVKLIRLNQRRLLQLLKQTE